MKRFVFVGLVLLFSCDYFNKEKVYAEDLLEEQLQAFNWNEVDEYPSFASCDDTSDREGKKQCFEQTLLGLLNTNLKSQQIIVSEDINDTVALKITIGKEGEFSIDSVAISEHTKNQIPKLDSLLRASLDSLPEIYPAIKRSQQVSTQFVLPVVIKID